MMTYWTNFARTGNPNGTSVPNWPAYNDKTAFSIMHLNVSPHPLPETHRDRYEFFDAHGLRE
jgi:para-nitrobenzyl esterase